MDHSLENNPKYPINNSDPAHIAHRLKFSNIAEIKTQIELVQTISGQLMDAVNKLSWMQLQIEIGHEHKELKGTGGYLNEHKKDE